MNKVITINNYFSHATKKNVEELLSQIIFSDRQEFIFNQYYIHKKSCGWIADELCVSVSVVTKELHEIRNKLTDFI